MYEGRKLQSGTGWNSSRPVSAVYVFSWDNASILPYIANGCRSSADDYSRGSKFRLGMADVHSGGYIVLAYNGG